MSAFSSFTAAATVDPGGGNGDGSVNIKDAFAFFRFMNTYRGGTRSVTAEYSGHSEMLFGIFSNHPIISIITVDPGNQR